MSEAWLYQRGDNYCVGWYEPDGRRKGKSCGSGTQGQRNAVKLQKKLTAELLTGTYEAKCPKTWADFRQEYEAKILPGLDHGTGVIIRTALEHFQRIVKPIKAGTITTRHIDDYIATRRTESGKKRGTTLSPASLNKELRHLKAAFNKAKEWKYLSELPKFHMVKEPDKEPQYVSAEHFAAMYAACDVAKLPSRMPFAPADWWRALLTMAYMTGWRVSEILALRREDLDLEAGTALTRAEDNKGGRDARITLQTVVLLHLRKLVSFDSHVFPWNRSRRVLQEQFASIQEAAGIKRPCRTRGEHEHSRFCYVYGFHDLRRAFASMNADRISGDALQTLMRHKSYTTTKKYIDTTRQIDEAVGKLFVPDVLRLGS